jgi:hypothetical protein
MPFMNIFTSTITTGERDRKVLCPADTPLRAWWGRRIALVVDGLAYRNFVEARSRTTPFRFAFLTTTIDNDNPRRRTRSTPRLILPVIRYNGFQARVCQTNKLHAPRRQRRLGRLLTGMQSWFLRKQAQDDPRSACVRTLCDAIALLDHRMRRSNKMLGSEGHGLIGS